MELYVRVCESQRMSEFEDRREGGRGVWRGCPGAKRGLNLTECGLPVSDVRPCRESLARADVEELREGARVRWKSS